MLLSRFRFFPITPIGNYYQTRLNSKITYQDKRKRFKKPKESSQDKSFLDIASEGRKLSESTVFDKPPSSVFDEQNSQNRRYKRHARERPSKVTPRDSLNTILFDEQTDRNPKKFTRFSGLENLEKIRMGEGTRVKDVLKRDDFPLFSSDDASKLFIQPNDDTTIAIQRESPFEKDLNESVKFLNSLLYSNPFKDMKDDPYDLNYPVNNEDAQPTEKGVSFKDHVILDQFYKDFPKTGPIRNFMELVITGMSQNAYLSPEEKREHVEWFKKEIATLSPDEIKKMDSYVKPLRVRLRRLKIKVI